MKLIFPITLSILIPFDFFASRIVTPSMITVAIIVGLYMYYEKKNKEQRLKSVMDK